MTPIARSATEPSVDQENRAYSAEKVRDNTNAVLGVIVDVGYDFSRLWRPLVGI